MQGKTEKRNGSTADPTISRTVPGSQVFTWLVTGETKATNALLYISTRSRAFAKLQRREDKNYGFTGYQLCTEGPQNSPRQEALLRQRGRGACHHRRAHGRAVRAAVPSPLRRQPTLGIDYLNTEGLVHFFFRFLDLSRSWKRVVTSFDVPSPSDTCHTNTQHSARTSARPPATACDCKQ